MKHNAFGLIASAVIISVLSHSQALANTASVNVINYSLGLGVGSMGSGGSIYFTTYDGSTGFPLHDTVGSIYYFDGELKPTTPGSGTYRGDYLAWDPIYGFAEYGSYSLALPTTDTDGNGCPDILQLDKAVNTTLTGTGHSDWRLDGYSYNYTISGPFYRAAASDTGTYSLTLNYGSGSTTASGTIQLSHWSGTVSYTPGNTNLSLSVTLVQPNGDTFTVTGTPSYTINSTNQITIAACTLLDELSRPYSMGAFIMQRNGNRYRGNANLVDGNKETTWGDYRDSWVEIVDTNDGNGNGVPDLSDPVTGPSWLANEIRVGSDGKLRLLWQHLSGGVADGRISLWTLTSNLVVETANNYGTYSGWSLSSEQNNLSIGPDNKTHLYWRHTSGAVSFWTLSSSGLLEAAQSYGPYAGWDPQYLSGLSVTPDNKLHCWWRSNTEAISVWTLNSNGVFETARNYGPYTGWEAYHDAFAVGADGKLYLLWENIGGANSLWRLSGNGDLENAGNHGPYAGWTTADHDPKIGADNKLRLLWNHSSGAISLWILNSNAVYETSASYGPYTDWRAGSPLQRPDNKTLLGWRKSSGEYSLWVLSSTGALENSMNVGPYAGWEIIGADVSPDNRCYLLWKHTSGQISLWRLSPTGTIENTATFGPY